jgi:hypothetical protein
MPSTLVSNMSEKADKKPTLLDNQKEIEEILLQKFKASVEYHAKTKSPEVFKNGDMKHSQIVLEAIFKYAENNVVIYDNELNGEIAQFPSCQEEIIKFLDIRKGKLSIIVDSIAENNTTYDLIKAYKEKGWNVNLFIPEPSKSTELKQKRSELHDKFTYYTSADGKMIRVEKSDKNAYCSFNQPELADKLLTFFNLEKKYCTPLL